MYQTRQLLPTFAHPGLCKHNEPFSFARARKEEEEETQLAGWLHSPRCPWLQKWIPWHFFLHFPYTHAHAHTHTCFPFLLYFIYLGFIFYNETRFPFLLYFIYLGFIFYNEKYFKILLDTHTHVFLSFYILFIWVLFFRMRNIVKFF